MRSDELLDADFSISDKPQDECGVFGVWAPGEEVGRLTYFGLYALQHRGQQSAGIAASDGKSIMVYKDLGLVSQVFNDQVLSTFEGHIAIGHVRYSTKDQTKWKQSQPILGPTATGSVALGNNGNLNNVAELRELANKVSEKGIAPDATGTQVITALLGGYGTEKGRAAHLGEEVQTARGSLIKAALEVLPRLSGGFSMVFMDERTLYGARDPHGLRPLVLGRLETGWVLASETAALDIVGATFIREIKPGELIAIDSDGVRSFEFAEPTPHGCVFEYVYIARPDTRIAGRSIMTARLAMGAALAREHPVEADFVISTPESGTPAAMGYAQESGIPYTQGLVKNSYVGRTFIQPTQSLRQRGIRLKLNPLREVVEGKRLVVVDDSIVRGNTQRQIVRMLREAGAAEIHVRISSPPVGWPCFFGIDFPTRAELISSVMDEDAICRSIGADSLGYLSLEGMVAATGQPEENLCMACFTGKYPMPVSPGTPIPGTPGITK
ncbi:MAG: amidophosphoribosyltransferase [Actinomycetaceae bacterium]|nr:amidophosphoribosyltransferase [Actinomycetaceae bacterium]